MMLMSFFGPDLTCGRAPLVDGPDGPRVQCARQRRPARIERSRQPGYGPWGRSTTRAPRRYGPRLRRPAIDSPAPPGRPSGSGGPSATARLPEHALATRDRSYGTRHGSPDASPRRRCPSLAASRRRSRASDEGRPCRGFSRLPCLSCSVMGGRLCDDDFDDAGQTRLDFAPRVSSRGLLHLP